MDAMELARRWYPERPAKIVYPSADYLYSRLQRYQENPDTDTHRSLVSECRRFIDAPVTEVAAVTPNWEAIAQSILEISEFNGFVVDEDTISVETEWIELEDIVLGRFRISLSPGSTSFRVFAMQPNPSYAGFVHPHVHLGTPCLGEASIAVAKSIETGNLALAFELCLAALSSYNEESTYHELANWHEVPKQCGNCETEIDDDSSSYCDHCNRDVCEQCYYSCYECETPGCISCLAKCWHCGYRFCGDHILRGNKNDEYCQTCSESKCSDCGNLYLPSELADGKCEKCQKEQPCEN